MRADQVPFAVARREVPVTVGLSLASLGWTQDYILGTTPYACASFTGTSGVDTLNVVPGSSGMYSSKKYGSTDALAIYTACKYLRSEPTCILRSSIRPCMLLLGLVHMPYDRLEVEQYHATQSHRNNITRPCHMMRSARARQPSIPKEDLGIYFWFAYFPPTVPHTTHVHRHGFHCLPGWMRSVCICHTASSTHVSYLSPAAGTAQPSHLHHTPYVAR